MGMHGGHFTIFTLEDCPHCRRAKAALKAKDLTYSEISLTTHPQRRKDMLSVSNRLTVPQVFLADRYIGGADETLEFLKDYNAGEKDDKEDATEATQPPTDPRLQPSTDPPVEPPKPPPPRPESDLIPLPNNNGGTASVLETMEQLKQVMPTRDLPYRLTYYRNCCTGADLVQALKKAYPHDEDETTTAELNDEQALKFGILLQQRQILHHVVGDHDLEDSNKYYFRLQCYQTPHILNSYRIWTIPPPPNDQRDDVALVILLKKMLAKIESLASSNSEDGLVDYVALQQHELFPPFEEAACELQTVDLGTMDRNTLLAFGINAYNLFVKYAFIKVGIPNSSTSRSAFFTQVKFNIGGHLYSFNDFEHGILRGNRRPPYTLSKPIGSSGDPRLAFVLESEQVDCRIHFALNCGAKSCPPVKTFTALDIEEELRIVAQAFCEDDNNVLVDQENQTLYLSKILSWYMVDFCAAESELPLKVMDFLHDDKKARLQIMLDQQQANPSSKSISIKYMSYDWGTDASNSLTFDAGNLKASYYSVTALFWSSCRDRRGYVQIHSDWTGRLS